MLTLHAQTLYAQYNDMQAVTYNLGNVLPTDLIKASIQDKRGFVWLASDAGLVRFDGRHSTLYRHLPSPYVKALLRTRKHEVLALTDLGLVQLREEGDSIRFPVLIRGSTEHTDSTLFYAKSLFESSNGDIWIGEPSAVVRLRQGVIKRFSFDPRYTADSFTRAFSFAEDNTGSIIVVSQRGRGLFRFDERAERFIEIPTRNAAFSAVSALMFRDRSKDIIWIATTHGVYETSLHESHVPLTWRQVVALRDASSLATDDEGNVYIGTWYLGLYMYDARTQHVRHLSYLDSKTINDIRIAPDGNVWISADDGLTLLHPYGFTKPRLPLDRPFIQQVFLARNGDILVSDGASLLRMQPHNTTLPYQEVIRLTDHRNWGAIIAITERPDSTILCGTSGGYILAIRGMQWSIVQKEPAVENYCFWLYTDRRGWVWRVHNPDGDISVLAADNTIRTYSASHGMTGGASVIRASPQGTIYIGGRDSTHYLFRYNAPQDRFENISAPLPLRITEQLIVNDLAVESDSSIWLATNYGMLHYNRGIVDTIPFSGDIARRAALAVTLAPQGVIFATDHGVYMYTHRQIIAVDLRLEKVVMSPIFRGLVVDNTVQLWLGTRSGVLFSKQFAKLVPQTPMPTLVSLKANGHPVVRSHNEYTSGVYMHIEFTALCYPAEKVRYQTRLVRVQRNGRIVGDTAWREARFVAEEIFPSIASGDYILQVRAQQEGFLWSEPMQYRFTVQPAWYARWWAWLLYSIGIVGLMYGTARYWSRHLEKRNRALQRMVDERTAEIQRQLKILDEQASEIQIANTRLQEQNLQLVQLNNEKNEFLGIVAHDLKNPLTGIMMTASMLHSYADKMPVHDIKAYLTRIEETSKRMYTIITELLDINAIETGHINIAAVYVNISALTKSVVEDFRERAEAKRITLHFRTESEELTVLADPNLMVQVLENIISNAIKYSPSGRNVFVSVTCPDSRYVRVTVRDEGPGLSPQDKEKLFRKFAKLSAKPTGGEHSTGLGLSIVKRIVEAMQGTISCESELGQGAAFIVDLPLAPPKPLEHTMV
ncbi:MAG: ATP-binding protein [Bacteroidota bacterium]|nr:ATP-binding protein [Candidatus Kapabacteria bacterium]MDW8220818.1 ATP-binding protein [Bacteroidota bacterium]